MIFHLPIHNLKYFSFLYLNTENSQKKILGISTVISYLIFHILGLDISDFIIVLDLTPVSLYRDQLSRIAAG